MLKKASSGQDFVRMKLFIFRKKTEILMFKAVVFPGFFLNLALGP